MGKTKSHKGIVFIGKLEDETGRSISKFKGISVEEVLKIIDEKFGNKK